MLFNASALPDTDEKITSEVARLKLVIREAWEAWEKSKADYNSKTQRQVGLPNKDYMRDLNPQEEAARQEWQLVCDKWQI